MNPNHNHEHGRLKKSWVIKPGDVFQENQQLIPWVLKYLDLRSFKTIEITEFGCTEDNCPVDFCIVHIDSEQGEYTLRLGRQPDRITKNDVYFAVKKQFN